MIGAASSAALWAIPVASTIISIASLGFAALGMRKSADASHVANLQNELADARSEAAADRERREGHLQRHKHDLDMVERRLNVCEDDRKNLRNEVERMGKREIELMGMIVDLQRKVNQ